MYFQHLLQQSLLWRCVYYWSSLLLNIAIARALGATESSTIFYLSNLFSLFVLIGGMSLENAFIYYTANKTITTAKLTWFGLIWILGITVLTGAIAFLYFHFAESVKLFQQKVYIFWAVIFTAGTLLINFYSGLFYAADNFKTPNIIRALLTLLLAVMVFFSVCVDIATNILIHCYFYLPLMQGIIIFFILIIGKKKYWQPLWPSSKERTLLMQYGLRALTANIVFFLVYRLDYWVVANKCSAANAGNYMQAAKFAQLLWLVPQMLATVVFPKTAAGTNEKEIVITILRFARVFILVYIFIFLFVVLAGHSLLIFLLGNSFDKVSDLLLLLIPGIAALALLTLLSAYFAGINQVAVNIKGALAGLLVFIALSTLAWNYYNIYLAAVISSVCYCTCFLYAFKAFSKQHKVIFKKLLIFDKADRAFIIHLISKNH